MTIGLPKIKRIGLLEFLFASYPILSQYQYGFLRLDVLLLLIMASIAMSKKKGILRNKSFSFLCLFLVFHNFIWLFITGGSISEVNNIISYIIYFVTIALITPALDMEKLENSLNLVALIVMAGLLLHLSILTLGGSVTPIKIPFFPDPGNESRFADIYDDRPSSFFVEPGGVAQYLIVPLAFALKSSNFIWAITIILFIFLSASTNGVVFTAIIIFVYMITQGLKWWKVALLGVLLVGGGYIYLTNSAFEVGRDKLEGTKFEQTSRLFNGPEVVFHMPSDHLVLGIPYHTIEEYYDSGALKNAILIESNRGFYFVSSFWDVIIFYGLVGFVFFSFFYAGLYMRGRPVWPYLTVIIVGLISSSKLLNATWVFETVILLTMASKWCQPKKIIVKFKKNKNESININDAICK